MTHQNDTLRVLMISDVYFPRVNGVSTSVQTFRRELAAEGIETHLVAPDYPVPHAAPNTWRVPSHRLPLDEEDRLMKWRHLDRQMAELTPHAYDVVHVQTPFAAHYAGVKWSRRWGASLLVTYHTHFEEYFHHYLKFLPRKLLRSGTRQFVRSQCRAVDELIVPSAAMVETLKGYGVGSPMTILPTGIPLEQFRQGDGAAFRRRLGIEAGRPMALVVSRMAHEKNLQLLLEATVLALKSIPELLLVLAGDGPAIGDLKRKARELGITDHVRFLGYLDRSTELPACYDAADLFVFSSHTETQGLVVLEAMAAGVPVLAIPRLGVGEIIAPGRGAVSAPDDAQGFGETMARLLSSPERLAQMGQDAAAYAEEWSAAACGRRMAEVYRRLADRPRTVS